MRDFLASGIELSKLVCTAEDCLSWILVLFNILTIFYLVFCAWFKINKIIRIIGLIWTIALTGITVAVVAYHTCTFTILSAVFTGLVLIAVISVVFNKGDVDKKSKNEKKGKHTESTVTRNTTTTRYRDVGYGVSQTYCIRISVWNDGMRRTPCAERTYYLDSPQVRIKRRS